MPHHPILRGTGQLARLTGPVNRPGQQARSIGPNWPKSAQIGTDGARRAEHVTVKRPNRPRSGTFKAARYLAGRGICIRTGIR